MFDVFFVSYVHVNEVQFIRKLFFQFDKSGCILRAPIQWEKLLDQSFSLAIISNIYRLVAITLATSARDAKALENCKPSPREAPCINATAILIEI